MEIRQVLRGKDAGFVPARPARREEGRTAGTARPATDRVELSRQWIEGMEEQRAMMQSALLTGGGKDKKDEGGLLGFMETEEDKLDAMSEELDVQMKCLKIAMNIMKGKKVPPEDERYLMEHDPEGYKLAIAMRSMEKEDDEECESVLKDEDKNGEESSGESGGATPTEDCEASANSSGEE